MKWEVAVVYREGWRRVVGSDVEGPELWAYVATAMEEPEQGGVKPAVLVTRMDYHELTFREREAAFYDTVEGENKNGKPFTRRVKRYKWLLPLKDWDRLTWLNNRKWKQTKSKADVLASKTDSLCRNGDDLCACLVLDSRCRIGEETSVPSSMKGQT